MRSWIYLVSIFGFYICELACSGPFNWLIMVWLFGWLVGWMVGWFILVLVECLLEDITFISLLGWREHKSSTDHNPWQPGHNSTLQIWKVVNSLGIFNRGCFAYTYDISPIRKKDQEIADLLPYPIVTTHLKFFKLFFRSVYHKTYCICWSVGTAVGPSPFQLVYITIVCPQLLLEDKYN